MSVPFQSRVVLLAIVAASLMRAAVAPASEVTQPALSEAQPPVDWAKARQEWAYQTPKPQSPPAVRRADWPRQRLDYFILAKLEANNLAPTPEAERRILLRRLSLDLSGLPPTPAEMQFFLSNTASDAYEREVDRLLGSPRFGERLASLWLNAARYSEDQAHIVDNDPSDFYPNAFYYRDWVIGAFNRDLPYTQFIRLQLAADQVEPHAPSDLAALGFIGLGPKYYSRERLDVMADEWEDRVDTVTRSFLGLTVACARCHDHKYDPIAMEDYYGLAGVFAATKLVNKTAEGKTYEPPEKKKDRVKAIMPKDVMHLAEDSEVKDLPMFLRGNVESPGPAVPRRFLSILSSGPPQPFTHGSGRLDLADAIADPANPLTARVMVNRLWALIFGQGLVATPSNFGKLAPSPTHPELLDDLATQFMVQGWSVKRLVRQYVLSATYRQGSALDTAKAAIDPDNRWLWRMNARRLTVEQWRDSVLAVAGNLDLTGKRSMALEDPANGYRTVYGRISRLALDELLTLFDYPDPNGHAEKRSVTTTATQKLYMLNGPFLLRQATVFAARLGAEAGPGDAAGIRLAYALLYGRAPSAREIELALAFLGSAESKGGKQDPWVRYAHVLLNSTEMLYVD